MTQIANVYAQALYSIAEEENGEQTVLRELAVLEQSFAQEPQFLRLLCAPNVPKEERCAVLDRCFAGKLTPYLLNFLKLLTERGYIRHFSECCAVYRSKYNAEHGILEVRATTALPLDTQRQQKLSDKLAKLTGKTIDLKCRVDAQCLGGIRLDYDGKSVDDTVAHRLEKMRTLLGSTAV